MTRKTSVLCRALLITALIAVVSITLCACRKKVEDKKDRPVTEKIPLEGRTPLREFSREGELDYLTPKTEEGGEYTEFYTIQVGAFGSLENAHRLLSELKSQGYDVFLFESHIKSDSLYKVGLGSFDKKEDARAYLDNLTIPGFEGLWITQVRSGNAVNIEKEKTDASEKSREAEMIYVSDKTYEGDDDDGKGDIKRIRWGVWLKRGEEEPILLAEREERIRRPVVSPDGKRVAFIVVATDDGGGKISIVDTYGSKKESVIPAPVPLNHHIWLSSEVLAYVSTSPSKDIANKIVVYNIIERKGDVLISSKENRFKNMILSPKGRHIAYNAYGFSPASGEKKPIKHEGDEAVHVETINLETGKKGVVRAGYTTRLLGWYPDGNLLVAYHLMPDSGKSYNYSFAKSDPEGKNIVMLDEIETVKNVGAGVTSPDGRRIAFVTWKITEGEGGSSLQSPRELWLMDIERGDTTRLLKRDSLLYGPSWSPGGDELAVTAKIKNRLNLFIVEDFGDAKEGAGKRPKVRRLFDIDDNSYDAVFH